ncbi:unnamed protein product [Gordionus sp. m RMFG-2023]|uniref:prefoldin subunit 2-like n=1 Tax=Gordionus sp. m RMFG-2023 TaxID=3053472 RepID=UPI0030E52FB2
MATKSTIEQEQIINGFNKLRSDQRTLAIKATELESDIKEHDIVIEALANIESKRKCYRQIGGVLVERTVGEVLPALQDHKNNIVQLVTKLNEQIETKGKQIFEYQNKHKIQISTLDKDSLMQAIPIQT